MTSKLLTFSICALLPIAFVAVVELDRIREDVGRIHRTQAQQLNVQAEQAKLTAEGCRLKASP